MIHVGDSLKVLRKMPDESVQCCVTSPPYWGLRDYGTAKWKGGDPACDHSITRRAHGDEKQSTSAGTSRDSLSGMSDCRKCGAKRVDQQLGLESTPEEYVSRMVEIFREVRRVLKNDGTLWLNLGDCYATGGGKVGNCPGGGEQGERWAGRGMNTKQPKWANALGPICQPNRMPIAGLKPKDLVGIPWRVAFALQADGWYLRSDIIWHKPNPMPESVTDRPTKSHEYLFLLTKSARYFYDGKAIREPFADERNGNPNGGGNYMRALYPDKAHAQSGLKKGIWLAGQQRGGRNKRTVWTITTKPFKGAHFATFPPKLIEPCILAGSRVGDTVLDPFAGAGTTGLVAQQHERKFIGIELNPAYAKMARLRIATAQPQIQMKVAA